MPIVTDVELDWTVVEEVVVKLVGIGVVGTIVLSGMTTEVPLPGTLSDAGFCVVEVDVVRLFPIPPFENPSEVVLVIGCSPTLPHIT